MLYLATKKKRMPITEKTATLSMKLVKQYLGFQFLLTSPSPFVPPGTPDMRVMFYDFLNLTNEGVMRHIEGCIVQGGDMVGFRRRPLNVSTHLAAIFSSVSGILSSLPTPSLSVVWSVVLCRVIVASTSSSSTQCLFASLTSGYWRLWASACCC